MTLSGAHINYALRAAGAGGGLVASANDIAESFNLAMTRYGNGQFNTSQRVAALVSECMMESAYFRTTEEYYNKGRYMPFKGRTFIQITWKDNYAKFGKWCVQKGLLSDPNYFVDNPERLADFKWAAVGGVWYFTNVLFYGKPLVEYSGNIAQVGRAVNLGDPYSKFIPNGESERLNAYKAVRSLGSTIVSSPASTPITGRQFIMATGTRINKYNAADQVVADDSQWHDLKIDEPVTDPRTKKVSNFYSFHSGETPGLDVSVTIRLTKGQVDLRGVWYTDDPRKQVNQTLSVTNPLTLTGASGVQVRIAGTAKKGELVRVQARVVAGTGDANISDVKIDGWVL